MSDETAHSNYLHLALMIYTNIKVVSCYLGKKAMKRVRFFKILAQRRPLLLCSNGTEAGGLRVLCLVFTNITPRHPRLRGSNSQAGRLIADHLDFTTLFRGQYSTIGFFFIKGLSIAWVRDFPNLKTGQDKFFVPRFFKSMIDRIPVTQSTAASSTCGNVT